MTLPAVVEFACELFAGLGSVTARRMFGGAGVYAQGRMFALIADEVIYLKADEALKRALREAGSEPFIWIPDSGPKKGQRIEMSYWRLPDAAMDDPDEAVRWGRQALGVALANDTKPKAKQAAKPRKRKP
jgi:DNA transformation protein and related proteins